MVHYKCARCNAVMQVPEEMRGQKHTCTECGMINIVPGGRYRPIHRHGATGAHAQPDRKDQREAEEVKEPLTVGKVLRMILLALVALGGFGVLGFMLIERPDPAKKATEVFFPHLDEYARIDGLKEFPRENVRGAYIVGKAVLVNVMDAKTAEEMEREGEV
ncbi:MAG: hypothetical protein J7M21_03435, partial [Planctomycetes bacterium]|nr:hypothetical protein [Planctomycetota bacterium]